jgi:putative protease
MNTTFQAEHRIELLAPGGSADAIKAAILAGADAVYCGLPDFNARRRADNITPDQLPELVRVAHQHDCRMYLTLNTLILDGEMEKCAEIIAGVRNSGVDAIIVQDIGLLYMLRRYFPDMKVHASTQMTMHNCGQIAFLAQCGIARINMCRELALPEITLLANYAKECGVRSEVFVHGAYCISFSGQCYMSSTMSGRSGNRGECVQPCRRTYSYGTGAHRSEGTPFNLKDNSVFAFIKDLERAGVSSVKIEGRIKGYKYVYIAVSAWRRQLDRMYSGAPVEQDDQLLHSVFNRSLSAGYLEGTITKEMFIDSSRDQSLVPVATIRSYTADTGQLRLERDVAVDPETPVLIYTDGFTFVCTGFLITKTGRMTYQLKITHKLKGKISSGDMLYRQADFELAADVRAEIDGLHSTKRRLAVKLSGKIGTPLYAEMTDGDKTVTVATSIALVPATSRSLSKTILEEKLGMLGETEFTLAGIDVNDLEDGLFLPVSELNDLRRRGVALLTGKPAEKENAVPAAIILRSEHLPAGIKPACAILTNNVADLKCTYAPDTKLIFELPVTVSVNSDSFKKLFSDNPSLIPWFPAILIGRHYTAAVTLLETIRPRLIVTDNSGVGWAAGNAGIPWIAGPLLNCVNSLTLTALQEYASCSGAFISHELSKGQMTVVTAPERMSRWYTVFAPLLLMNTRQCIVRNCTGCKKESADHWCLESCNKSVNVSDDKNSTFFVTKRPGFYNQIYNNRHYFNPAVVHDVDADNAVFLVDLRSIASKTEIKCSRQELIALFESFIAAKLSATRLREVILQTTSAQYTRGI